jgi:hypothetical protein
MKKIIYSDEWGQIIEYTRYRGKGGRFVSDKYGRRRAKVSSTIKTEIEQWRVSEGRRTEKISVLTPDRIMKVTFPGGLADHDYDIYETLRDTNIFTQVSKAQTALINIRGYDKNGNLVRLQDEIKVGEHNQDKQLAVAVSAIINESDYKIEEMYQPDESRNIHARYYKKDFKEFSLLQDVSINVTLMR